MRTFYRLVCILFSTAIIFSGCTWEEHEVNGHGGKVKLLKTGIVVNQGEPNLSFAPITYEYDAQDRVTKWIATSDANTLVSTFTYNSVGDLVMIDASDGTTHTLNTYSKNGNIIIHTREWLRISDGSLLFKETYTFELNAEDLLVKIISHSNNNYDLYEYQNGNVTKITRSDGNKIYATNIYTYDNKKNPLLYCKRPKWFMGTQKNNVTSIQMTNENISGLNMSMDFVYTYDNDGFPVTVTVSERGKTGTSTATYTYIIK